jgi:hypothetical protein
MQYRLSYSQSKAASVDNHHQDIAHFDMALNWAMLTEDGSRPVPLPGEKVFFSVEKCSVALDFKNQGVKWSANGNAFVTSQRIVFLRQPPLPAPADPSVASAHLRSLSVPLAQFVDTRYLIPIFTAPYFEASIIPSPDGGLPQRSSSAGQAASNTGLFKLWFNEGGGMAFRDAVEEVKSRLDEGSTHIEALPLYEPREQAALAASSSTASAALDTTSNPSQTALPDLSTLSVPHQTGSANLSASPIARRPARSDSMPFPEDLEAARVAREAEERERDLERQRSQQIRAEGGHSNNAAGAAPLDEEPPPYPA